MLKSILSVIITIAISGCALVRSTPGINYQPPADGIAVYIDRGADDLQYIAPDNPAEAPGVSASSRIIVRDTRAGASAPILTAEVSLDPFIAQGTAARQIPAGALTAPLSGWSFRVADIQGGAPGHRHFII